MPTIVTDPDVLESFSSDQSGLHGTPIGVVRPHSLDDVVELVRESSALRRPLLPVGCQTATSGAGSPDHEVVLSMKSMAGVVDIDRHRLIAEVLPGTITADLKAAVAAEGLYYPPDPTSEAECTIGGNVASNASGARTFRWGTTASWVHGVELVSGNGEVHRFFRSEVDKNTAGYLPFHDPLDAIVGSEGTLGVVTRVWLRLIPDPGPFVSFILFLPDLDSALSLAVALRLRGFDAPARCVELFDAGALALLRGHARAPTIPDGAHAALYVELDKADLDLEDLLARYLAPMRRFGVMLDDTIVGDTLAEKAWIRDLRHHIPETCNKLAAEHHAAGGLKVSADFAVPPDRFLEMMHEVERGRVEHNIDPIVRYGHVGNGHPHIFMCGRTPEEVQALRAVVLDWSRRVVSLGGTVAAEHGIGKTRRYLLPLQYPAPVLAAMRGLKSAFDPHAIFARGNIF